MFDTLIHFLQKLLLIKKISLKLKNHMSIKKAFNSKEVNVEIEFFTTGMKKFQKEEPVIHLLYPSSEKLVETTVGRLLKSKAYTKKKEKTLTREVDVENVYFQLPPIHDNARYDIVLVFRYCF